MQRLGLALVWALVVSPLLGQGWEKLTGCEYHEGSHSDGDSIEILRDASITSFDSTSSTVWKGIPPRVRAGPCRPAISG
jgi:hypothetical protein